MFRFLWISDGPTYSTLPVNAKEVSGDVRFRRKILFYWLWVFCSYTCSRSFGSELCLLSIFTHSCIYLVLRTRRSSLHGMGVATLRWACTHLCHSLNKSLGWIILLMLWIVAWSFGCRLKFIYSVVLVDEQVYLLSLYSLCYIYILYASDVRVYKGDFAEIY